MNIKQLHRIILVFKYLLLIISTFYLLSLGLNIYMTVALIIVVDFILIKIEFMNRYSVKMLELIKEKKYTTAARFGENASSGRLDIHSKTALMIAYYKAGEKENAIKILKQIEKRHKVPRRLKKIIDYWKVKMMLNNPNQLN